MYDENYINTKTKKGWIEVITGSMFSGKTEELIRRLKRAKLANQKVKIFKHALDNRSSMDELVSHDDNSIPSMSVSSAKEIVGHTTDVEVVGIDEGQFFADDLIENHCCRSGYGLSGQTVWFHSFIDGSSRFCNKAACCLCQMRKSGTILTS